MKRSLSDIFKREYEVRLSVSPGDTIAPGAERWNGAALLTPDGDDVFRGGDLSGIEKTFALLRGLRPRVLRIDAVSPDLERWMEFCRAEEICPHLVFPQEMPLEQMEAAASACAGTFSGNELWNPVRFYEISCASGRIPFEDDASAEAAAASMKAGAERLRGADPEAKIILGGLFPSAEDRGRADLWDRMLLEHCGSVMDMIGVRMFPAFPDCPWDQNADGIEVNWAMAEELRRGLQYLELLLRETVQDREIRIAVTGWGPRQDGTAQKRQDCVFLSAVYSMLRNTPSAELFECGPLFGKNGLLAEEDGQIFGNVFFQNMLLTVADPEIRLRVKETEQDKGIPVYHWEDIPGVFSGGDIPLLEIIASRSPDGKRLFLFLTNRSPFRLAVPRIRFSDMPDMHPVKALILRSKKRLDENTSAAPDTVYCKEVKLRNYRKMDHVTLEIPECSTACMVLE